MNMKKTIQEQAFVRNTVTSNDGAQISYFTHGTGPGILVIPGALANAATYMSFAHPLTDRFTVHIIERRGRPQSSPQGEDYSIEKECEDAQSILSKTGTTLLVGHSYGGLVALEVARHNLNLTKVAVYEPGVSVDGAIQMGWMQDYEKYLKMNRPMDAFVRFSIGAGSDSARNTPPWLMKLLLRFFITPEEQQRMFSLLQENLREHREVARLDNSYANYHDISANVLLMYGEKTGSRWVDLSMKVLPTVLQNSEMHAFPKLDHFGIDKKAPEKVAEIVKKFFLNP
jgi:pimeloyl-ACP methyl ester carboxylesterase